MPLLPLSARQFIKRNKRKVINAVYDRRFGRFEREMRERELSFLEANSLIFGAVGGNAPFFAGRMGTVECGICWGLARAKFHDYRHSIKWELHATRNAGISLKEDEHLNQFGAVYTRHNPAPRPRCMVGACNAAHAPQVRFASLTRHRTLRA